MKLRPPAYPLITVDPYFSVWSQTDNLYDSNTVHWTNSENPVSGTVTVDDETFRFMGLSEHKEIKQIYSDVSALVTDYVFENRKIVLKVSFYSTLFPADLYRLSRPVSFMKVSWESNDGGAHIVSVKLSVSEEICINKAGETPVFAQTIDLPDGQTAAKIGSVYQKMLERKGDDLRIEWGYFYLCGPKDAKYKHGESDGKTSVSTEFALDASKEYDILFAYDDIKCLKYFEKSVDAYWKTKGICIEDAICEAKAESDEMLSKCRELSEKVFDDGENAGGEKYAELLSLAFRQTIAAHKLAVDENGEIIFISKECFSNGCAATVDVTYPSAPFFLLYNPELLKGMLRPIFKYSASDDWKFDFAPHDVGTYPLVNGQMYGVPESKTDEQFLSFQMPVEECGNMLIMMANIAILEQSTEFCDKYYSILDKWVEYLIKFGKDPENQLCTDDFAGHLAHNCNLSLKAIMGIAGYAKILLAKGDDQRAYKLMNTAKEMAESFVKRAANEDGSFRLAYDRPDTFSMKYNIVWDKLWGTKLFAPSMIYSEFCSNKKHFNAYGMPLDNRATYTKSDWTVWTAALSPTKEEFEQFIAPMWEGYNVSKSRVPMTDWYDTVTGSMIGFRHRSVQGGLFIKLLEGRF